MDLLPPLAPVFLTQREVADLLRVPVRTVEDWRLTRSGPPWVKPGRHVRYEQAELLAWVKERPRVGLVSVSWLEQVRACAVAGSLTFSTYES